MKIPAVVPPPTEASLKISPFSVAMTAYNRPEHTVSAVLSCLRQGSLLREVVVVDDASTDKTAEEIEKIGDIRVRLLRRNQNGGIGAARKDAFAACRGRWIVALDSDHELIPGALKRLNTVADPLPETIGIIGARHRWDTGAVSPSVIPEGIISYKDRIRWSQRQDSIGQDYVFCVRRAIAEQVNWSTERSGLVDSLYQLDCAKLTDAIFIPEELCLQKSDAAHGHTRGDAASRLKRRRLDAEGGVKVTSAILNRHEAALAENGPGLLANHLTMGAFYAVLVSNRTQALHWLRRAIHYGGWSSNRLLLAFAVLLGPALMSVMYVTRIWWRETFASEMVKWRSQESINRDEKPDK